MEETKAQPLAVRVCAELFGSFLLCFAIYAFSTWGSAVYGVNIVFAAVLTGLAYAAMTSLFAHVSGGQLNPAITVAAVLVSKTKLVDGLLYVVAQVLGAIAAGFAVVKLLPTSEQVTSKVWLTPAVNGFEQGSLSYSQLNQYGISFGVTLAIIVEVIGSMIVVGAAMSALNDDGKPSQHYAQTLAAAYAVAAAICYPVTGIGLNPARSTGIAIAAQGEGLAQNPLQQLWVFWISPVLAAAVVALAMIIVQMVTAPKQIAPETAEQSEDPTEDDAQLGGAEAEETGEQDASEAQTSVEDGVAEQSEETEVRDEQADSQGEADEGVERH